MFKIKEIIKTAKETMAEILKYKDMNITGINHLIYAAATVTTKK